MARRRMPAASGRSRKKGASADNRATLCLFAVAALFCGGLVRLGCVEEIFRSAVSVPPQATEQLQPAEPLLKKLLPGDSAVTTKETLRWVKDIAWLWLSLDERRRQPDPWSKDFGSYKQDLIDSGRVLCIPVGTRVKILSMDTDRWGTCYEVELLEGEYTGRKGWLGHSGIGANTLGEKALRP